MIYEEVRQDQYVQNIVYKNLKKLSVFLDKDEIKSEADYCLLQAVNTFDPSKGKDFYIWIGNVSYYHSLRVYNNNKKRIKFLPLEENQINSNAENKYLKLALGELNEIDRSVIIYKHFYGYTHKEIAQLMGLSKSRITQLVKIAHNNLKKHYVKRDFS